jgi:hemerythrin
MKRLELTDDMLTGITEIDNQHRELFARGNAVLFPVPADGKATKNNIITALLFLINYVDEHFSAEERLMKYYGYDRLNRHQKQHQRLHAEVVELHRRAMNANTFDGLLSELQYLFGDWYVYHIKEWDQSYALFLQSRADHDVTIIPGLKYVDDSEVKFLKPENGHIGR